MLPAEIPVLSFEGENEFVTDIFSFQLYILVALHRRRRCAAVDVELDRHRCAVKVKISVEFLASSSGFRALSVGGGEIRET